VSFALGVVLFAVGIGISIALHEAGHMWTAKAFGMKVRRYFIGFGPKIFSFRRGETEYGLKWIPAGGFCDIAGMTALDPVTPDEAPRAFFTKKTWQRVVVLSAGSIMHFLIGIVLIYLLALGGAVSTPGRPLPARIGVTECVAPSQDVKTGRALPCPANAPNPATQAGLLVGDRIISVGGKPTQTFDQVAAEVRQHIGPTQFVIERDGQQREVTVNVAAAQRLPINVKMNDPHNKLVTVGAIGVEPYTKLGPLEAIPATVSFTGFMFKATFQGLGMFPEKIPAVFRAIGGAPPDLDRPVSVVGASVVGGDAAKAGDWAFFVMLLAALNFFVGVFNLVPLLPLDGGHIAVNLYERVRDSVRRMLGREKMPPVDYTRLLPVTYAFILVIGAISLLTITADIINPIHLPN
jgi:membrane-associated protease RseP (regulator of RpoE activity)